MLARQQLGLAILMHDGAHRRFFRSVKLNDWACQFLCAGPLFFSMFSYLRNHLKHHQNPLAKDDPDLPLIGGYPISKRSFARKLFRDAVGISYFKFIRYFLHLARKQTAARATQVLPSSQTKAPSIVFASIVIMQILIFSLFLFWGHPLFYLVFWLLPAMTALQLLLRVRGIAEHAGFHQNIDQRLNARTVINPVQTLIFAPHNVAYHLEHHAYPGVPCFNLPKLHRLMREKNMIPEKQIYPGYGAVIRELVV